MDETQSSTDISNVPQQTALATQLPPEIIAEIFQFAILPDSTAFLSPQDTGTDRQHFKTLRSVCRYWRATAFSTQSLWTVVWIDFKGYQGAQVQSVINSIKHYFSYAGPTLPLTLGFKWGRSKLDYLVPAALLESSGTGGPVTSVLSLWLSFLFEYRTRWTELSFFTTTPIFYEFEANLVADRANGGPKWAVQCLQVYLEHVQLLYDALPADATTTFQDAFPQLETVILDLQEDTLISNSDTHFFRFHLTVTKLELNFHRACDPYLQRMCGAFPNLTKLALYFRSTGTLPAGETGPIVELPELDFLIISFPPSFNILSRLHTPKLRTLQFLSHPSILSSRIVIRLQKRLAESFHHLLAFVQKSGETLRAVRIDTWFMRTDEMLRLVLEPLGSVEVMCVDTWFIEPAQTHVPKVSLPKLRKLCIHHREDLDMPEDVDDGWDLEAPSLGATTNLLGAENTVTEADHPLNSNLHSGAGSHTSSSPSQHSGENPDTSSTSDSDTDQLPIRKPLAWPSLGAFVRASGQHLAGEDKDAGRGKFVFCASGLARRAGGSDARRMFEDLENAPGVRVVKEPTCTAYW